MYYISREWIWLAVKVNPPEGEEALAAEGELRPLRISFASSRIVYTLKFSAHQGTFDVNLYVVTSAEPQFRGENALDTYRFTAHTVRDFALPGPVSDLYEKVVGEGRFDAFPRRRPQGVQEEQPQGREARVVPFVTKISGTDVNGPSNPIASWPRDFTITMASAE